MRLEGKVALITGGAHGMGAVEAKLFAREGARVAIADLREDDGRKVEAEIVEAGGQAVFLPMDVTQEDAWRNAVTHILERFDELNVLVNNAGISGGITSDLLDTASWDRLMEINAKGVFLGIKYAIPEMRKTGGGSIVNIFLGIRDCGPGLHAPRLQRLQGGGQVADQDCCGPICRRWDPGELGAPRTDAADADIPAGSGQPTLSGPAGGYAAGGYACVHPHGKRRPPGRSGQCRAFLGFRRCFVYHGHGTGGGRWLHRPVGPSRRTPPIYLFTGPGITVPLKGCSMSPSPCKGEFRRG